MLKIALAIGHNFAKSDRGAVGNGTTEADTTKALIADLMGRKIQGVEFVKVPEGLAISERCKWVNSQKLDALFEFHLDSATPTATGSSFFYVDGNSWAKTQAEKMSFAYSNATGLRNRGAKPDTSTRFKRLGAIRDVKIFAILVELGFISNATDLSTIRSKGFEGVISALASVWPEIKDEKTFWNGLEGSTIADDKTIALMVTRLATGNFAENTTGKLTRQQVADFLSKTV